MASFIRAVVGGSAARISRPFYGEGVLMFFAHVIS